MELMHLLTLSQDDIKAAALALPDAMEVTSGNVLVRGSLPLVLVAHMDTVYNRSLTSADIVQDGHILRTKKHCGVGIGGDDRAGCFVLFQVAKWNSARPWLLFCSDEETCAGSSVGLDALEWSHIKAFIEVDAPGYGVFYSDDSSNDVLDSFMADCIGLHMLTSSYNDIAEICTSGNPPGVTLGAAYYEQHNANEETINTFGLRVVLDTVRLICDNLERLPWSVVPEPKKARRVGDGWHDFNSWASDDVLSLPSASALDDAALYDGIDLYGVGDYGGAADDAAAAAWFDRLAL